MIIYYERRLFTKEGTLQKRALRKRGFFTKESTLQKKVLYKRRCLTKENIFQKKKVRPESEGAYNDPLAHTDSGLIQYTT